MKREEKDCANKELQSIVSVYEQEPGEYTWNWIMSMIVQRGQNIPKTINSLPYFWRVKIGEQRCCLRSILLRYMI